MEARTSNLEILPRDADPQEWVLSEDGPLPTAYLMSESSPEVPPPAVYAQSWLVRFGFALVAAFTLILGLAFLDHSHRQQLETVSETTAVGDTHYFQLPSAAAPPAIGAMLGGQPLYVAETQPFEVRDTHTRRVGGDAERGLAIYELSPAATDAERGRIGRSRRAYLLKTDVNQYVTALPADGQ